MPLPLAVRPASLVRLLGVHVFSSLARASENHLRGYKVKDLSQILPAETVSLDSGPDSASASHAERSTGNLLRRQRHFVPDLPFVTQACEQHSALLVHATPEGWQVTWQAGFALHCPSAQSTAPSQSSSTLPVQTSVPRVQSRAHVPQVSPF
jgi:hypothetical protein